jgi:hypothetical protein
VNLWITPDVMVSEDTEHTATRVEGGWELSWLPGRVLTRQQGVTGMVVAEIVADGLGRDTRRWALLSGLAAQLGLTGLDAAAKAAIPPGSEHAAEVVLGAAGLTGRLVRS